MSDSDDEYDKRMVDPDEFDKITKGMSAPDPELEGAAMAAKQLGMFYSCLKAFGIPDAQAEYLTKEWMVAAMDADQQ